MISDLRKLYILSNIGQGRQKGDTDTRAWETFDGIVRKVKVARLRTRVLLLRRWRRGVLYRW